MSTRGQGGDLIPKFSDIDTPSGHIVCGFILLVVGAFFNHYGIQMSDSIIGSGVTTIGIGMKNQFQGGKGE